MHSLGAGRAGRAARLINLRARLGTRRSGGSAGCGARPPAARARFFAGPPARPLFLRSCGVSSRLTVLRVLRRSAGARPAGAGPDAPGRGGRETRRFPDRPHGAGFRTPSPPSEPARGATPSRTGSPKGRLFERGRLRPTARSGNRRLAPSQSPADSAKSPRALSQIDPPPPPHPP